MPRTRIPLNISVPTEEDREMIKQKAAQRKKSISELVLEHFRRLPNKS